MDYMLQTGSGKQNAGKYTAIAAAVCIVLQLVLAPHLGFLSGFINFSLLFAAFVVMCSQETVSIFLAFFAGLFYDLCASEPLGLMALCLCVAAFVYRLLRLGTQSFTSALLYLDFLWMAALVLLLWYIALGLLGLAQSVLALIINSFLPAFMINALCFCPFWYVLSRLNSQNRRLNIGPRSGAPDLK